MINIPRDTKSKEYMVYKHTCVPNGKVYVGITSTTLERRCGSNGKNYQKNTLFWRAIQKYGWDAFSHEILASGLTLKMASELEKKYISELSANNPDYGYNISSGGEGGNTGCTISDELREEKRIKMSGENNPCYGHFGPDHPAYGYKQSEEVIEIIKKTHTGKKVPEDAREKMSLAMKKRWEQGCYSRISSCSKESARRRQVVCVETGVIFDSVKAAAESVGVASTNISQACLGKLKTCKGLHWQYVTPEENDSLNCSAAHRNSNTGVVGVFYLKKEQKWASTITIDGRCRSLGRYIDFDDAVKARLNAELQFDGNFFKQEHLYEQYGIA